MESGTFRMARDTAWAMSEENVEVVRKGIEALNRRDVSATRAVWRSDAEIDWSRSKGPLKGVYRGRREVASFQNEFWSTFEKLELEPHGFTQAGRDVVVPNTAHLRGREGMQVIARSTFVFTVENGQITRLRMFQERAEALEALGLSE
jgi:ketosteroid isomerase-like protein